MKNIKLKDYLLNLVKRIKDYWFLITLCISILGSLLYMLIFQVTPWDKYYEIKHRREQIKFHNVIGYNLLERGYYELSKTEFDKAINLDDTDFNGLTGRYLSRLFQELKSPDWDPAIGLIVQNHLHELGIIEEKNLAHIVEKYIADFNYKIGKLKFARKHYERAIDLKADYLDALFSYGWFNYSGSKNIEKMEIQFKEMTLVDTFDYRGFHGYGYALYMQAINSDDPIIRNELIYEAARQSERASHLLINQFNIVMDFGEIARSIIPKLSINYHEWGLKMFDDPDLEQLPRNRQSYGFSMLAGEGYVVIGNLIQKRAVLKYQLALDYLALYRIGGEKNKGFLNMHDNLFNEAKKFDLNQTMFPIYVDQLKILDRLLPSNKNFLRDFRF